MEEVTVCIVEVRKGSRCDFAIEIDDGVDDDLTQCAFRVARNWSDADVLLDLEGADVVADFTDPTMTVVSISINATALADVEVPQNGIVCAALLTMQNPADPESVFSIPVDFKILPDV